VGDIYATVLNYVNLRHFLFSIILRVCDMVLEWGDYLMSVGPEVAKTPTQQESRAKNISGLRISMPESGLLALNLKLG
jgi:hypothetical protein